MTSIITILTIVLIECVFGVNYVDVKSCIISRGLNVFHGRFSTFGKYFMLVGDSEPISELRFGNELIFPKDDSNNYNLFVEIFIKNDIKIVSFYVHTFNDGLLKSVKRKVISVSVDSYRYLSTKEFMRSVNEPILVSIDIGPKPKHPFIKRLITEYSNSFLTSYYTYEFYEYFKFDGKSSPQYRFGYVYDSDHPTVIGYTQYPYMIEECFFIKIFISHFIYDNKSSRFYETSMIEIYDNNVQRYELRPILGKEYWFLIEYDEEIISTEIISNALNLYKSYVNSKGLQVITLDISEIVTPELFGIEKITGLTGNWTYKLYNLKKEFESNYKIKIVIDPKIARRKIYIQTNPYIKYNVEVYRNSEKTYVCNHYNVKKENAIVKILRIYNKKTNDDEYKKIKIDNYKILMKQMEEWYPIKLDVTIDEEPPSLFEKREISNKEMTLHHFSIKETDDFGDSTENKFVFGRVYRTSNFEIGNIPQEQFRKHKVMIVGNINTNKFIVRNKSTFDDLRTPQYQLFRLRK